MTSWHVYVQAAKIAKGVELEFFEQSQVSGSPATPLAAGDRLRPIEFPNNERSQGSVDSVDKTDAVITESGKGKWKIRYNRSKGNLHIWLVVDAA